MTISRADVEKVARLAELDLEESGVAELQAQLARILEHVEQLGEVREAQAPAPGGQARLRKDVVNPDPLAIPPERFAPEWKQGLFVVPRLAELDRGDDAP
jgi:aspartyl-tRNA(Asn)/glutamyl-tRNA(Gln) amidotransferase subunit C